MSHTTLTPDEQAEVERQVYEVLQRTPAYHQLDAARRRKMSRDMVEVLSAIADPGAGDPEVRALSDLERVEALDYEVSNEQIQRGTESALDELNKTDLEREIGTTAGDNTGAAMAGLVKAVDFPVFVANLIQGVFQAIVDASIQQMEAYQSLLEACTASVTKFMKEIPDSEAQNHMTSSYPNVFKMMGGGSGAKLELQEGAELPPELAGVAGSIDSEDFTKLMMQKARQDMAKQKQQMMATMVLLGINRIIVTDGKINAKVEISVEASEIVDTNKSMEAGGGVTSNVEQVTESSYSDWYSSRSKQLVKTQIGTASGNQDRNRSQNMEAKAKLTGEVEINFRSETFPLEKIADTGLLSQIEQTSDPNLPNPEPAGAAAAR